MLSRTLVTKLLHDPTVRLRERAGAGDADHVAETLRELGRMLEPGGALVAILLEHEWARALEDAAARTGGTALTNEFVDATELIELAPDLLAAALRRGDSTERG